ncbi:MAG: lasso peptide biosynthesis B2 protein [Planctomycetia bacterium]|nr:lasso peptide biosynthesis B2 protein [Planctomycetia bacterium]
MKTLLARLVWGRRARTALAAARADLATTPLDVVVAGAHRVPLGRPAPRTLRGFARALRAVLEAEGEPRPCLPRALALLREARRRGVEPTLVLGVARAPDASRPVVAHAWLEAGGAPFLEVPTTRAAYTPVATFPPGPA